MKVKIYEIAKKMGVDNKQVVEIANKNGIDVKSHLSSVTEEEGKMLEKLLKGVFKKKSMENQKEKDGIFVEKRTHAKHIILILLGSLILSFGIYNQYGASTEIEAISGFNSVVAGNSGTAIYSYGKDTTVKLIAKGNSLSANTGIWGTNNGQVTLTANNENNEIITSVNGIYADTDSDVDLIAQENNNIIKAGNYGIYINDSEIELIANKNSNIIKSGVIDEKGFGNKTAIYALSGSNVNLTAANKNDIAGWVYAYGDGTTIDLKGVNDKNVYNSVLSSTGVNGAGGLTDITVVSALFADNKSNINLSGINNIQTYYDDPEDTHTSERAVWAYKGANINIDG